MDCFKKLFSAPVGAAPAKVIPIENVSPVKLSKDKILGIDVSHYEPAVDWVKAKAGGVLWMYTKASEGSGHVDVMLHKHCDAAKAAGVYTGAYHFFHASVDGAEQAKLFLKTINGMKLDLPPCLDWESGSADGVAAATQKVRARAWLDEVEKATGRVPVIYGGEAFMRELRLDPEFARYPLWLAHYGVKEASVKCPAPWAKIAMWQYTDAESVPGLGNGHHVDANWFYGSDEDLKKFCSIA